MRDTTADIEPNILLQITDALTKNDLHQVKSIVDTTISKQTVNTLPERLDLGSLVTKDPSDEQCLCNDWAFERRAIIAVVAPTGIGKSVLTMQLSTAFACGKETIGFRPNRAYKVLVIQCEDSDQDIALMRDGSFAHLTDNEKKQVLENLVFIRLSMAGTPFFAALHTYCEQYKPDVIFINPLLRFYGGDPMNTESVIEFLNQCDEILNKYNCGMILVNHTIKQSKLTRNNQADTSYASFGASAWSNAFRDTIEIRRSNNDGYFKLLSGKRSSKWGWKEQYIQHSGISTLPYWTCAKADMFEALLLVDRENPVAADNKDTICRVIPQLPQMITINEIVLGTDISERAIREHLKSLIAEKRVLATQTSDDRRMRYSRPNPNIDN
jgi:hypothetical protein